MAKTKRREKLSGSNNNNNLYKIDLDRGLTRHVISPNIIDAVSTILENTNIQLHEIIGVEIISESPELFFFKQEEE